jgi:hypothetical protein
MFAEVPWAIWSFGAESAEDLQQVRAMRTDPGTTVEQLAKCLGVKRSMLYRRLPGGRAEGGDAGRGERCYARHNAKPMRRTTRLATLYVDGVR